MASWYRKKGKYVVVFVSTAGKLKALPRDLTRHLDGEPDHNIDYWLTQYEITSGLTKTTSTTPDLTRLVEQYIKYFTSRDMAAGTAAEHKRHLLQHVIPYFLSQTPPMEDPNAWATVSVKMLNKLTQDGLTGNQIFRCNIALRNFYKWLAEERVILGGGDINLRNPMLEKQSTPLKYLLTPDQILELATKAKSDFALALLCGYFLSLRPQELFGLKPSDFRGGSLVSALECSKAMNSIGLFSKLAVNVARQRNKQLHSTKPKAGSGGWVSCFSEPAAKQIVELIKPLDKDNFILSHTPNYIYKMWPFDFALKDLRRASLYWLGHETAISQNQLMKHARHQSYETTLIYLRRPTEEVDAWNLDLDA